jgi:hypothetical protein
MMMEAVVAGPSQNPQNHGARVLLPERSATTWLSSEGEGGGERGGGHHGGGFGLRGGGPERSGDGGSGSVRVCPGSVRVMSGSCPCPSFSPPYDFQQVRVGEHDVEALVKRRANHWPYRALGGALGATRASVRLVSVIATQPDSPDTAVI